MRSSSLNYMPALDGLRAIAVLMVFVQHAFPGNPFPGGLGVDVFFVISGFLITRILLTQHARRGSIALRTFYLKRLLRLYPALVLMVATFIALWFTLGIPFRDVIKSSATALTYTSNIVISHTTIQILTLRHTWSLAMEEQFYLVWPILLILLLSLRLSNRAIAAILIFAAAASLAAYIMLPAIPYSPVTRAGALIIGCATAVLVQARPWENRTIAYIAGALLVTMFMLCTMGRLHYVVLMVSLGLLLPFLLVHLAFGQGWLVRALSAPWMAYLGVISYAIYLWHNPILQALHASTTLGTGWAAVIALVLTLAVSMFSHRFVERPFNRIKDRLRPPAMTRRSLARSTS